MTSVTTQNEPESIHIEPPAELEYANADQSAADTAAYAIAGKPPRRYQTPRDPWLALAAVVVFGGISGIAYFLGFVQPYQLARYYTKPLQDLAKINGYTAISANEWALTWIIVGACYFAAFRICPSGENISRLFRRFAVGLIFVWAAFFAINLIFMYPVGAADIFDQIFRARLTAHYGFNPFTTLPNSIANDPFQQYVAWRGDPSPYGPVWELLAALVSFLAGGNLWANLIEFKLLVVLAYGLGIFFTYGILRTVKPEWALRGTLLFAWNPLLLFEVAGNGHNDAIVVMFMLAAIYFLVRARRIVVLPALLAGALTKFVPILLVPAALAALWRDRWGKSPRVTRSSFLSGFRSLVPTTLTRREVTFSIVIGSVISLGLAMVVYAPFWTGIESILPRNRGTLFTASIPKVILDSLIYNFHWQDTTAQFWVRNTAYAIVGIVAITVAVWVLRTPNTNTPAGRTLLLQRTLIAMYEVIFAYLLIASLWFQPWYLLWLVALTAPIARIEYVIRTMLFCFGAVMNYFVWDYLWLWNKSDGRTVNWTACILIYTLPILYTLYVWTIGRKSNQEGSWARTENSSLRTASYELQ